MKNFIILVLCLFLLSCNNIFATSYTCNDEHGNYGFFDAELMKKGMCYETHKVTQKYASGECFVSLYTTKSGKSYVADEQGFSGLNTQAELNACFNNLIQHYSIVNMLLKKIDWEIL